MKVNLTFLQKSPRNEQAKTESNRCMDELKKEISCPKGFRKYQMCKIKTFKTASYIAKQSSRERREQKLEIIKKEEDIHKGKLRM